MSVQSIWQRVRVFNYDKSGVFVGLFDGVVICINCGFYRILQTCLLVPSGEARRG